MKFKSALLRLVVLLLVFLVGQTAEAATKSKRGSRARAPSNYEETRSIAGKRYRWQVKELEKNAADGRAILNGTYKEPDQKVDLAVLGQAVKPADSTAGNLLPLWAYPVTGVGLILVGLVLGRRMLYKPHNMFQELEPAFDGLGETPADDSLLGLKQWDEPLRKPNARKSRAKAKPPTTRAARSRRKPDVVAAVPATVEILPQSPLPVQAPDPVPEPVQEVVPVTLPEPIVLAPVQAIESAQATWVSVPTPEPEPVPTPIPDPEPVQVVVQEPEAVSSPEPLAVWDPPPPVITWVDGVQASPEGPLDEPVAAAAVSDDSEFPELEKVPDDFIASLPQLILDDPSEDAWAMFISESARVQPDSTTVQ